MISWMAPILVTIAVIAVMVAILWAPSRWDQAVLVKVCRDGTPILRLADGSFVARRTGFVSYRVEELERVCR